MSSSTTRIAAFIDCVRKIPLDQRVDFIDRFNVLTVADFNVIQDVWSEMSAERRITALRQQRDALT